MINILITGGNGFVGRNLVEYLSLKSNYNIDICDNSFSSSRKKTNVDQLSNWVANDFDELSIDNLKKYDCLIHLAAVKKHNVTNFKEEDELYRTNFINTRKLFLNAAKAGIKKIIFSSSLYAHGAMKQELALESDMPNPRTLYGQSKLFGEQVLREVSEEYNIDAIAFRLYFIYGPKQYFGKGYPSIFIKTLNSLIKQESPRIINDGSQTLDYLHVNDLCSLLRKAIEKKFMGFKIVNASSGNLYQIKDIVNKLTSFYNEKFKASILPHNNGEDFTNGTFRSGSNEKAKDAFDWAPLIDIDNGVKSVFNWYFDEFYK